jgi:hypothetical protein
MNGKLSPGEKKVTKQIKSRVTLPQRRPKKKKVKKGPKA